MSKIEWSRVPDLPDMLRSDDWALVIRRVYDDGAVLYQLWDSSPMLDQKAALAERCAWRFLGWNACADAAKEDAEAYKAAQTATVE